MFDVETARKIAEDFMQDLAKEDRFFWKVGMTIRKACNEVETLRARLAEAEKGRVPYCLGRTTIERLAEEGQMEACGLGLIAADDLFKQNPYARAEKAEAERDRYREALEFLSVREHYLVGDVLMGLDVGFLQAPITVARWALTPPATPESVRG